GSGTTYTLTVNPTGVGTFELDLVDKGNIHDLDGNPLVTRNTATAFQNQATFTARANSRSATYAVAVADLNGDGSPDLVVGNVADGVFGEDPSLNVLLGNGNGTFQNRLTFAAGDGPRSVAVSDLN